MFFEMLGWGTRVVLCLSKFSGCCGEPKGAELLNYKIKGLSSLWKLESTEVDSRSWVASAPMALLGLVCLTVMVGMFWKLWVVWNVLLKADVFKLTDLRGSPLAFLIEMNLLLMSFKNISLKTIGLAL